MFDALQKKNYIEFLWESILYSLKMFEIPTEFKTVYEAETYMSSHIIRSLRTHYTKFRLSSHILFLERGRWLKPKLVY